MLYLFTTPPLYPTGLFPSPDYCLFQNVILVGTITYVTYSDWLLSISNTHLTVLTSLLISFKHQITFNTWMHASTCVCLPPEGHLGYLHVLAVKNKATVNICVQVSV